MIFNLSVSSNRYVIGAAEGVRTPNLSVRSRMLYPVELQLQANTLYNKIYQISIILIFFIDLYLNFDIIIIDSFRSSGDRAATS